MTDPLAPTRPNPSKAEEDDGPPLVKAVLIGAPLSAAILALAVWAPWALAVGMGLVLFGIMSWCVGLVVMIAIESQR